MFSVCDDRTKNSLVLGIGFILLFSAYNALANIQKTLMNSIQDDNPSFTADGYQTQGILYTVFSLSMWLSPGIIAKIGPKLSMTLATIYYGFYFASFYFENNLMVYIGAGLCGLGASCLWTGQANYIVLNSAMGKVYKEIGIFWILYQSSHFFGNLIIYFEFSDVNKPIDTNMRRRIIAIFVALTGAAIVCLLCLKPPVRIKDTKHNRSPIKDIWKCCRIVTTKHMLILWFAIVTCGAHLTFLSVLSASMGFSQYLSQNSKELAPLCGLLEGCGEVIGGLMSIFMGGKVTFKMKPVIAIGCLGNLISYIIVILTIPNSSLNNYSQELPFVILPLGFLLVASLIIGIGDACLHTELYDHIGNLYPNDSASAFAVFKFFRAMATAVTFYYAKFFSLHLQAGILIGFTVLSFVTYHYLVHFSKPIDDDSDDEKKNSNSKPTSIKKSKSAEASVDEKKISDLGDEKKSPDLERNSMENSEPIGTSVDEEKILES